LILFPSPISIIPQLAGETRSNTVPIEISKISFLIHPVCWDLALNEAGDPSSSYVSLISSIRGGAWYDDEEFLEILQWEREVNEKQKEYIRRMESHELLIIYPIGQRPAMLELERLAKEWLGPRCIIVRSPGPTTTDYRELLPSDVKSEITDELLETLRANGEQWSAAGIEVMFYHRMLAMEIEEKLQESNLKFDPETVELIAFGEGFEQCAMTWKAMLPYYLRLRRPIENDFELSVSGMPLLRTATFKERVALSGDVRLFLWELADGRPMALFARAKAHLKEPQLFVSLPFNPRQIHVYDTHGRQLWPPVEKNPPVQVGLQPPVKVPVFAALRQFSTDYAAYLVATEVSFSEFRQKLIDSPVTQAGK
jgi:hypothetical protein